MKSSLSLSDLQEESQRAAQRSAGLWERLVLGALAKFTQGTLRLRFDDGSQMLLGGAADGPQAEIRLRDEAFFHKCALYGNVGLGESYVDGDWETDDIRAVISWFIINIAHSQGTAASSGRLGWVDLLRGVNRLHHWLRPNSVTTSRRNIAEHYDLGNDFYSLWLDETMTYSAARFTHPGQSLADAQRSKYEALCEKLRLQPSDHVLEIGCGWGGFCCHVAREYGCRVTAVTISEAQRDFAVQRVAREGLSHLVEIRLQDYRHITGQFDKIASIEMLEAVGDKYLEPYFAKCAEVLKPEGLLAFQMITVADCQYDDLRRGVDWIQKHIFPGSLLLSVGRVNQAINRTGGLFMHGLEDLGAGYAHTLRCWLERFDVAWPQVNALGFDERFRRKWRYYLQYCEAAFATRNISVVQAVYTRPNNTSLHQNFAPTL